MNTNSNKNKVNAFLQALRPKTEDERIEFEAQKIHLDFIFLLQDLMKQHNISKKQLAQLLDVAPSYVTQLFNGTRLINLKTLAKIQKIFDIKLKIVPAREIPFRYKRNFRKYKIESPKVSQKTIIAA